MLRIEIIAVVSAAAGALVALGARPPQAAQLAKEALAAGVHVKVCANTLAQMGVSPERLDPPGIEVIPNAMTAVVDYVARGAAVVRY
jgi:intracellular sulfur oxidation DsrE/DsrF family protein